jgi:hypothetical protein
MLWLFWQVTSSLQPDLQQIVRLLFFAWVIFVCRIIKYMEHFARYPEDLRYILLIPLFGYFHCCFIKVYAMLTMHIVSAKYPSVIGEGRVADRVFPQTTWGSRAGADADDRWRLIPLPGYSAGTIDCIKTEVVVDIDEDYLDEQDALLPKYAVNSA